MFKKVVFCLLACLLVISFTMSGCSQESASSTKTTSSSSSSNQTAVKTTSTSTSSSSSSSSSWYDYFGEPQYGGTLNIRIANTSQMVFDPGEWQGGNRGFYDGLFGRDWALDRAIYDFKTDFVPDTSYYTGGLAESWERNDPTTMTVHIRQGVYFQDKEPVNGRELTAEDVKYSWDRITGKGSGFTEANAFYKGVVKNIESVSVIDDYTVEFKFNSASATAIYDVFSGGFLPIVIMAPETEGLLTDWKNAVGTGPYMLIDFQDGVGNTYQRNPDYWAYDERYPDNQLPYCEYVKEVVIADVSTTLAALRSGKLDLFEEMNIVNWKQAEQLLKTNPEIKQATWLSPGQTVELRCDNEPFTDIRVRKALQLALDLKTIGSSYYGGLVSGEPEGLIYSGYTGWVLPYSEWSAELQEEYSYNPDKARELLAEAGYPDGFTTNIIANSANEDIELLEIIKSQFSEIGVQMDINVFPDMGSKQDYAMSGKNDQMTYTNKSGSSRFPLSSAWNRTSSNKENYTYCNDEYYNDLIAKAYAASSIDEVKTLVGEANEYALKQHWTVQVFSTRSPIFWRDALKGNTGESLTGLYFFYYSRWWKSE